MPKRFTDTDKWKKPFIKGLQAPYKLLWLYVLDECDHAGIWQVDEEVAQIRIREPFTIDEAVCVFGDKIQVFDSGQKWFIQDFVDFQYGELNPANRVHNSVLTVLKKYKIKGLNNPLQRVKDKEQDKDKDKDICDSFEVFWNLYDKKVGDKDKVFTKWGNLSPTDQKLILEHLPKYKQASPDKQFRKDPSTYLNNKSWLDEIISGKSESEAMLHSIPLPPGTIIKKATP